MSYKNKIFACIKDEHFSSDYIQCKIEIQTNNVYSSRFFLLTTTSRILTFLNIHSNLEVEPSVFVFYENILDGLAILCSFIPCGPATLSRRKFVTILSVVRGISGRKSSGTGTPRLKNTSRYPKGVSRQCSGDIIAWSHGMNLFIRLLFHKSTTAQWCIFNNSSLLGIKIYQILTHKTKL